MGQPAKGVTGARPKETREHGPWRGASWRRRPAAGQIEAAADKNRPSTSSGRHAAPSFIASLRIYFPTDPARRFIHGSGAGCLREHPTRAMEIEDLIQPSVVSRGWPGAPKSFVLVHCLLLAGDLAYEYERGNRRCWAS
ncbi:hypothetical protein ACP4OV_009389 [Aristida adscensionis]